MTISVDWAQTKVIFIPKTDMVQLQPPPHEVRELDLNVFRLALRDLEEDLDGRPWPRTHDHETEVSLGGLLYARKIKILAPYTVTFEDGQYRVNAVGANSNIADVQNFNQVSVSTFNSAGLIVTSGGAGIGAVVVTRASMADDGSTARFSVWLEHLGVRMTTISAISGTIVDKDGALVVDLGAGVGPSADGTFSFACVATSLPFGVPLALRTTSTDGASTWYGSIGFARS